MVVSDIMEIMLSVDKHICIDIYTPRKCLCLQQQKKTFLKFSKWIKCSEVERNLFAETCTITQLFIKLVGTG